MGSKFCNLNIHGADLAAIESLCPNHIVRSISQSCLILRDFLCWIEHCVIRLCIYFFGLWLRKISLKSLGLTPPVMNNLGR